MKTSLLVASAVAATVTASSALAGPAPDPTWRAEKCYGINVAGKNDCSTRGHSCAGEATKANDSNSWIYVPVGTCSKIAGGSTLPKPS